MEGDSAQDAGMGWFKEYTARLEAGVMLPSQQGVRYSCPCCGYPTLEERGGFEICMQRNWEDDGQNDPHADEVWSGPNQDYSLAAARKNFKKYLMMNDPARPLARTNSPTVEKAKQALMKEYDRIGENRRRDGSSRTARVTAESRRSRSHAVESRRWLVARLHRLSY